jgi:hypothetical protein
VASFQNYSNLGKPNIIKSEDQPTPPSSANSDIIESGPSQIHAQKSMATSSRLKHPQFRTHQHSPTSSNRSKLAGSIPKPSASNPFNISISDSKIPGESKIQSFDLCTPHIEMEKTFEAHDSEYQHDPDSLHLPQVRALLPPPQPCPITIVSSPLWLIPTIKEIVASASPIMTEAPFIFTISPQAAAHNKLVLSTHDADMETLLNNHQHTILRHGSEFRPSELLRKLLMHHPRWPKFQSILDTGSKWPLLPISDNIRKEKKLELIRRGNHKSAITHAKVLSDTLIKEVNQGWMVPIPTSYVNEINHSEVAPVGIAQ